MSKVNNPFSRIFSLIHELFKADMISFFEKKILKEAIFNEDDQILNSINEYRETQDEEILKTQFIQYTRSKHIAYINSRHKSMKNSRTAISNPKTDQFSPRLASDSRLNSLLVFDKSNDGKTVEKASSFEKNRKMRSEKHIQKVDKVQTIF